MLFPNFDTVHAWLQLHHHWLGPAIAFIAAVESLAVVGFLVPGVPILFAFGAIAGAGAMAPTTMLVWAFAGAVLGDGVSFQLGYHYHHHVRYWWPFKRHPEWLIKGEAFFHNHGDWSIALGRFIGPVRPIVPVVAGMMAMPPKRFYWVNLLSAVPWAPVYLLPGYLAGIALQAHGAVPVALFSLLAGLFIVALVLPALALWLDQRLRPITASPQWLGGLSATGLILLLGLECTGLLAPWNQHVAGWITGLKMPYLHEAMAWLTWLGSLQVLWLPTAGWGMVCLLRARYRLISHFALAFVGMEATLWLLKWAVNSPRPTMTWAVDPFAFPSGHAAQATFILLGLASQSSQALASVPRLLILALALMLVILTSLSRLVLNVHWLGDVVAGFLLGLGWLSIWLWLTRSTRTIQGQSQERHAEPVHNE